MNVFEYFTDILVLHMINISWSFFQITFSRTMACQDLASMSPTEVKTFFDSYDTVLTDCDGVLWKGKLTTLIHNFFRSFDF